MIGMGLEFHGVTPRTWQKSIWHEADRVMRAKQDRKTKEGNTDTKKTSLNAAKRLFPTVNFIPKGKKVPKDGLYDAALIAEYGRREEVLDWVQKQANKTDGFYVMNKREFSRWLKKWED